MDGLDYFFCRADDDSWWGRVGSSDLYWGVGSGFDHLSAPLFGREGPDQAIKGAGGTDQSLQPNYGRG
jgi:hypothetical protein